MKILLLVILVTPFLLLSCICSLLAIWLAFGRTHVFLRMPAFLFGTLALGLVLCFATTETPDFFFLGESESALAYVSVVVLLAISFARTTPWYIRLAAVLYGALMFVWLFSLVETERLDASWIVRIAVTTSFVAGTVGTLRLFGFRLVNLTDGVSNLEIEKATGRDLDEWMVVLDGANSESLNHAEIMAFLRQYGFEFSWQKVVTTAYEKAIGRRTMVQAAGGRAQTVVHPGAADSLALPWQPRFTIWQWMLAIFCAACLLGFLRALDWHRPTSGDYWYGVPMTVGVASITLSALIGCLAIRAVRHKIAIALLVVFGMAAGVPHAMGFSVSNVVYFYVFAAVPVYAAMLMASLTLVRHRGYRLVRVQSRESPESSSVPCSSDRGTD